MSIRKMEIQDVPAILEIQNALAFQEWNEKQFASEIKASYAYCIVDELGEGNIAGYAIFHLMGSDSELLSIAVDASLQRSGIGEKLLKAGLENLDLAAGDACFLEVKEHNEKARKFYEKHGFKLFGTRKNYYSDGENAALYKLEA
ncbi:MAG: ribosomal protein S18-alanine N-acetyltransferase [Fibrobacter sp.]|nr:ribosomal protein S18-alanine N-acetyltransferase [Fibrobacter sp.]